MAKTTSNSRRRRSQALISRRGRKVLSETARQLAEQRRALDKQRKEAAREALKQQKHLASVLRKLGLYKPKAKRITNATIKRSGALRRKLRFYKEIPLDRIKKERPKPPPGPSRNDRIDETVERIAHNAAIEDARIPALKALAHEHSKLFFQIIKISHARYRAWKEGRNYTGPDWPDDWEIFGDDFPELFYYHSLI